MNTVRTVSLAALWLGLLLVPGAVALQAGVTDGLVAHYDMEGDLLDQSGNANHATGFGGITFVSGSMGQAASFDGIDDYAQAPRSIDTDFSVAFWLRTTVVAPNGTFWFEGLGLVDGEVCDSPMGGDWGIALLNGGHISFGGEVVLNSSVQVNDGTWHSVVLTRSAGADSRLYVDGVLQDSLPSGTAPLDGPPWIGLGNNACDVLFNRRWYQGELDEVRFYDRILTWPEILELSGVIFADHFEATN